MYHDIVSANDIDGSGFPGKGAAVYKLAAEDFENHLNTISRDVKSPPAIADDVVAGRLAEAWLLTFDDGGVGGYLYASGLLKRFDWRGHFFITTDYIGQDSFLSKGQIRELRRHGHVIGSHSCSHPNRMDRLSLKEIVAEWRQSIAVLSDIIGERVRVASVPAGFYSKLIAQAAGEAGIEVLFTSEPNSRKRTVGGCVILGRYTMRRSTSPSTASALAKGNMMPCLQQLFFWKTKKIPKLLPEDTYEQLRRRLLKR